MWQSGWENSAFSWIQSECRICWILPAYELRKNKIFYFIYIKWNLSSLIEVAFLDLFQSNLTTTSQSLLRFYETVTLHQKWIFLSISKYYVTWCQVVSKHCQGHVFLLHCQQILFPFKWGLLYVGFRYGVHVSNNSYYLCYSPTTIKNIFNRIRTLDSGQVSG